MDGNFLCEGRVRDEWCDINDHMNVAWYVLAFDQGIDSLWKRFGLSESYITERRRSTFAVESHICWLRELRRNAPFTITTQILAYDDKRIHQFMRMYHSEEKFLAATSEWMNLHVNLETRSVATWPPEIFEEIGNVFAAQEDRTWPSQAGKRMQVRRPAGVLNQI